MKRKIFLSLAMGCSFVVWAQTNSTLQEPPEQEIGLHSAHFYFDGNTRKLVYDGNVWVTNYQGTLRCEQLTIDLPPEGSTNNQPTNAVAEVNVAIDFVKSGDTNHITSDKAIYNYNSVEVGTNWTITFTGHAKMQNAKGWMTGEPLIWHNATGKLTGSDTETHIRLPQNSDKSTNKSPLDIFK